MQYVRIKNAGSLDRQYLFFIGGSKKSGRADDLYTIGYKGSGLKLALIGALRLNLRVIITSVDAAGAYIMSPTIKPIHLDGKKYHQIYHVYYREISAWLMKKSLGTKPDNGLAALSPLGKVKETPYLLEAFADCTDPVGADDKKIFKTAREFIVNAYDEDSGLIIDCVDENHLRPAAVNETIIYLEASRELINLLSPQELLGYFKFFEICPPAVHGESSIGYVYPKTDNQMTRLFIRGVLAGAIADREQSACFDYSLVDQNFLSEERVIKNIDAYRYRVGDLLVKITNPVLAAKILLAIANGFGQFENHSFLWGDFRDAPEENVRQAYSQAWAVFGEKAILPARNAEFNHRAEQVGWKLIHYPFSYHLQAFLQACGVKTSADVVPIQGQMDFLPARESELNATQLVVYKRARELLYQYFPRAKKYPIRLLKSKPGGNVSDICGIAGEQATLYKEICLNIAHPDFNTLHTLLETMIHEYCHCASQTSDYKAGFIKQAIVCVVEVIFKNEIERHHHVKPKSP